MSLTRSIARPITRPLASALSSPGVGGGYGPLPVANRYVSNTATNGYALGVNTGTGATKDAPWLTLDYAIANATSGDVIQLNDGTYVAATAFTVSAKSLTIQAEHKHGAILQAANTQARVVRFISSTVNHSMTLTGLDLDCRENTTDNLATGEPTSTAVLTLTVNDCKFSNTVSRFLFANNQKALNLTINRCEGAGTVTGQYLFDIRGHESGTVTFNDFLYDEVVMTSTATRAALWMNCLSGNSVFNCSRIRGKVTSSASGGMYGIKVENVDGAVIENCNFECSGGVAFSAPISVSCTNASYSANDAIIRNNRITNLGVAGYCIIMGTDATSVGNNLHNNAQVHGNTCIGDPDAASQIHGIMFGWSQGGEAYNNNIDGCGLATLAKANTGAYFHDNTITRASSEAIRAKGATNAVWENNTITISDGDAGDGVNVNVEGDTASTGIEITGNTFNIDAAPADIVDVEVGSDATFTGNTYNVNTTLGPDPWQYQGTAYQTLAEWKAAIEPTALP